MAVRPTMTDLIARVRRLVADADGADAAFSDDAIQEELDRHRTRVRYACLDPLPTPLPSGSVAYLDYVAPNHYGDWEGGVALVDNAYNPLTPESENLLLGEWTFPAHSDGLGQLGPVFLTGYTYDIYVTASDLLVQWMSQVKEDVTTTQQGVTIQRSNKKEQIKAVADQYAARRRPRNIPMRDASASEYVGGGWPR